MRMRQIWDSFSLLNGTVEFISSERSDDTILTVNCCFDGTWVKTVSNDGEILSSSVVTNVWANVIDDWERFGLITVGLVEVTEKRFWCGYGCLSCFPHHSDVLVLRNGVFTNLTSGTAKNPVVPSCRGINTKFEIYQVSTNFGINEWELISVKIFDQG